MPVQVEKDRFIEYRYDPDYLLNLEERPSKTYPDLVCASIGLKTVKSDLILDGGNVIRWKDKVILTDKVIQENAAHYRKAELLKKLEEAFQVDQIILIPWYTKEEFGHADGMLRFVDGNTVLVDGYYRREKSGMGEKLFRVLKSHRLEAVPLEFKVQKESNRNWGYLNFLQMEKLMLVPQFGIEEDLQALDQIRKLFPDYAARGQMDTIDACALIRQGGVLNCASWSIMTS
ncbi:MAG: agmatine deiminase family protein [Bacteroidales bacterium]|nr:agmatine deiminase family protein [Bacteroidales bacterium]